MSTAQDPSLLISSNTNGELTLGVAGPKLWLILKDPRLVDLRELVFPRLKSDEERYTEVSEE